MISESCDGKSYIDSTHDFEFIWSSNSFSLTKANVDDRKAPDDLFQKIVACVPPRLYVHGAPSRHEETLTVHAIGVRT